MTIYPLRKSYIKCRSLLLRDELGEYMPWFNAIAMANFMLIAGSWRYFVLCSLVGLM
jgi:hypothetical protein